MNRIGNSLNCGSIEIWPSVPFKKVNPTIVNIQRKITNMEKVFSFGFVRITKIFILRT